MTVCSGSVKARCRRLGAAAVTQGSGSGSGTTEERLCRLGKTRARLGEGMK